MTKKPTNLSIASRLFICLAVVLMTNYDIGFELRKIIANRPSSIF